jgi:hypothetical protein
MFMGFAALTVNGGSGSQTLTLASVDGSTPGGGLPP